jgi:SARP family transcriptional regulator, regulator of embCAB operon
VLLCFGYELVLVVGLHRPTTITLDTLLQGNLLMGYANRWTPRSYTRRVGEKLAPALRVYLTGRVCVECDDELVDERDLPRRQGRLAFAFLSVERSRAVPLGELAEILWPSERPAAWEQAVRALMSKIRSSLSRVIPAGHELIANAFGCYQLQLPPAAWVDLEAAVDSLHQAEGALHRGDPAAAYGWAVVASTISRRPFLAGDDSPWVLCKREEIQAVLLRAIDCVIDACAANGELRLALKNAKEAITFAPFRETGYQRLMRLHQVCGNRAEALLVYDQCAQLLKAELGIGPTAETEAIRSQVLSSAMITGSRNEAQRTPI